MKGYNTIAQVQHIEEYTFVSWQIEQNLELVYTGGGDRAGVIFSWSSFVKQMPKLSEK